MKKSDSRGWIKPPKGRYPKALKLKAPCNSLPVYTLPAVDMQLSSENTMFRRECEIMNNKLNELSSIYESKTHVSLPLPYLFDTDLAVENAMLRAERDELHKKIAAAWLMPDVKRVMAERNAAEIAALYEAFPDSYTDSDEIQPVDW